MEKHYYHISTKGIDTILFKDEEDFLRIIFILAQVFSKYLGTELVAYCIMNNHIHLVVYGNIGVIESQVLKLKKLYSMWYRHKYNVSKVLSHVPCKIRQCEDHEDVKNCIGYAYMNPVRAGITNNAFYYPWSSISAHFREESHPFLAASEKINPKGARGRYHTRAGIPDNIRLLPNGHIDPASIISPEHVEQVMKSSRALYYFVSKSRERGCNPFETEFLCNDTTTMAKAKDLVRGLCGRDLPLDALPASIKTRVADTLRFNYGTPPSVITRVLGK